MEDLETKRDTKEFEIIKLALKLAIKQHKLSIVDSYVL